MEIKKVWAVSFSPTRTSKKVVDGIVEGIQGVDLDSLDLTYPESEKSKTFDAHDLVVIGLPVYAGRVAPLALERLENIKGNNTPAVLVVLYGNREYEDALLELQHIVRQSSFIPIAAAAFVGEHSFSSSQKEIAAGRPDSQDLDAARSFGRKITDKLSQIEEFENIPDLKVPGNIPFKEGMGPMPITPYVDSAVCTGCGICVSTCPGGAITIDDELTMDVELCIFCCACIKICPENAVSITAPPLLEKQQWLHEHYGVRKEPELFY